MLTVEPLVYNNRHSEHSIEWTNQPLNNCKLYKISGQRLIETAGEIIVKARRFVTKWYLQNSSVFHLYSRFAPSWVRSEHACIIITYPTSHSSIDSTSGLMVWLASPPLRYTCTLPPNKGQGIWY